MCFKHPPAGWFVGKPCCPTRWYRDNSPWSCICCWVSCWSLDKGAGVRGLAQGEHNNLPPKIGRGSQEEESWLMVQGGFKIIWLSRSLSLDYLTLLHARYHQPRWLSARPCLSMNKVVCVHYSTSVGLFSAFLKMKLYRDMPVLHRDSEYPSSFKLNYRLLLLYLLVVP